MNKNIGSFLAFDEAWFKKHQRVLLFFCNAPFIKYWFRWVLRIHAFDCPHDVKITELAPSHFSYGDRLIFDVKDGKLKRERTTDFRTHPKFAKRLYYAFKPMWWAFHAWDWLVADRFVPQWSFGFSTLTQYPGSIGTDNPVDGEVWQQDNVSWSSIRAAAGTDHYDTPAAAEFVAFYATSTTNNWLILLRSIFCFDTSSLGAGSTISAATLSLCGSGKTDGTSSTPNINIYTSAPAATNALAAGDYDSLGSTALCDTSKTYSGWSTTGYNDFSFNASGISAISKISITKLGTRNQNYDVSGSNPNWANSQVSSLSGIFSNNIGTTSDPKLVVTYTSSSIKTMNGLAVASVKTVDALAIASVKTKNGLA